MEHIAKSERRVERTFHSSAKNMLTSKHET